MDLCRFEGNECFFEVSEEVLSLIVKYLIKFRKSHETRWQNNMQHQLKLVERN